MILPKFIFQAKENLIEKPWGGDWIPRIKGFKGTQIGESWEFSAHPSNPSKVLIKNKPVSLIDLINQAKVEILGKLASKYNKFPILVKILDISDRISVQVHPSDEVAKLFNEKDRGKSEAWLILGTGKVYIGFKDLVLPSEIDENGNIINKLNKFDANFLDTFKIPPGIVHYAERSQILEVSNNSNVTYKIYDFYGRRVEIEKAKKAIFFKKTSEKEVKGEKGKVSMENFSIEVLNISGSKEFSIDTFNILFLIDGYLLLKSDNELAELHKGYSCLVPALTRKFIMESDYALVALIKPL